MFPAHSKCVTLTFSITWDDVRHAPVSESQTCKSVFAKRKERYPSAKAHLFIMFSNYQAQAAREELERRRQMSLMRLAPQISGPASGSANRSKKENKAGQKYFVASFEVNITYVSKNRNPRLVSLPGLFSTLLTQNSTMEEFQFALLTSFKRSKHDSLILSAAFDNATYKIAYKVYEPNKKVPAYFASVLASPAVTWKEEEINKESLQTALDRLGSAKVSVNDPTFVPDTKGNGCVQVNLTVPYSEKDY